MRLAEVGRGLIRVVEGLRLILGLQSLYQLMLILQGCPKFLDLSLKDSLLFKHDSKLSVINFLSVV